MERRVALLSDALRDLVDGRAEECRSRGLALWGSGGDVVALTTAALADFWTGDFDDGVRRSEEARAAATDDDVRGLATVVRALAAAGAADVDPGGLIEDAVEWADRVGSDGAWATGVRYLAAEAALAWARLDLGAGIRPGPEAAAIVWRGHPIAPAMTACAARLAAFRGRIGEASEHLEPFTAPGPHHRSALALDAVRALVLGNAGDTAGASTAQQQVLDGRPQYPSDWIDRGVFLLLGYGAIASNDVRGAADLVLRAGGDQNLSRCTLVDRALGLELLLVAALTEQDVEAAEVWSDGLGALAEHPITAPTVSRARARLAIDAGRADEAVVLCLDSVARCREAERHVEAAEGEIVLARARIAARDLAGATRGLRFLVAGSDTTGHAAVRRSASAALSPAGRRLPPVAGAGWSALSAREAEIARLVVEGLEVEQVARSLHLSVSTVRHHLSRVLCAFGVASRTGLLAVIGTRGSADVPSLSPRQGEVAALVAEGRSNQQVADVLGISVKGVEKHVGDILVRWSARSRFDVARLWWSSRGPDPTWSE